MTDKQIIIDGKECRYWFRHNPDDYRKCSLRGKNDNCDEIKDCFIKEILGKLTLKEQECEELKEDIERWKSNFNGKVSAIEELLQQLDQFKVKNIKNSKTLTEIKEIAEKQVKRSPDGEKIERREIKQILQKISEVENEN